MVVALDRAPDLVAVAFVLIGGVIAWRALWRYWTTVGAVRRAEQARGTLHRVAIQSVRGGGSTAYVLAVDYTYQTSTQRLRGETVYPGGSRFAGRFSTRAAAKKAIESYEEDSETTVYYDPHAPDHSFLEPEPQTGAMLGRLGFGLGFVGLGVLTVLVV